MSGIFPGSIQPKKKRNPKALQLTAESLAPPLPNMDDEDDPPVLMNDLAPSPSSSSNCTPLHLRASSSASTITQGSSTSSGGGGEGGGALGALGKPSAISRKKPAGLQITKSIPTRPAPTPDSASLSSSSATPEGGEKPSKPRRKKGDLNAGHHPSSSTSSTRSTRTYQQKLADQLSTLDLGGGNGKTKTDLRAEDLKIVGELGSGNGGTVTKVQHGPSGLLMARKLVLIDAKPSVRKQILRELQIMYDCKSEYIVSFYGAFLADPHICICMEHMDRGSLDNIYRDNGPIDIDIVGKISFAVLQGLTYLYDVHRIIHRDVKPSNILVNSKGEIKLCDFGVSGELINSIANTFVGTSTYMSPERIQGAPYTVKSDVWSLGISLIELARGRFPFSDSDGDSDSSPEDEEPTIHSPHPSQPPNPLASASSLDSQPLPPAPPRKKERSKKSKGVSLGGGGMTMSILDLLQHIVNEPAPKLGEPFDGPDSEEGGFVDACLLKDPTTRPSPAELLKTPWMTSISSKAVDLEAWAAAL